VQSHKSTFIENKSTIDHPIDECFLNGFYSVLTVAMLATP